MKKKLFSMLLVLAMVLTMATSVSAYVYNVSFDESEYTTQIIPDEDFEIGYSDANINPINWANQTAYRNAINAVNTYNADENNTTKVDKISGIYQDTSDEENATTAWLMRSYVKSNNSSFKYSGIFTDTNGSSGKFINTANFTGDVYAETMVSFDFKSGGAPIRMYPLTNLNNDNGAWKDTEINKPLFSVSGTKLYTYYAYYDTETSAWKTDGSTLTTIDSGKWHNFKIFLNKTQNEYMAFLDGKLIAHRTGDACAKLFADGCSGITGIRFYINSATNGYFLFDNFKLRAKTTTFDPSVHNTPAYYPADMNYFETFNNSYLDKGVAYKENGSKQWWCQNNGGNGNDKGTIIADTVNWTINDASHVTGTTYLPYTEGGSDKYLRINFDADQLNNNNGNDNYVYLNYNDENGNALVFKTLNPDESVEGGYAAPTFNDDIRYFYETVTIGAFDKVVTSYVGNNAGGSYKNNFYVHSDLGNLARDKRVSDTNFQVNYNRFTVQSSEGNVTLNFASEEVGKMYKVDVITDLHTGDKWCFIDGKLVGEWNRANTLSASDPYTVVIRRMQLGSRYADGLNIDNIGYKVYSKYEDDEKTNERTIGEVFGDVFGTPLMYSFEILSDSTKSSLNVLARAQGRTANGNAIGDVIIATYNGNRLTNVVYGQTDGAEFKASFTNELASADKVVCYFLGAEGTAVHMQPIMDVQSLPYNNASYPDAAE